MSELPEDEQVDQHRRKAKAQEGEQQAVGTAARSFVLLSFLF